MRGRLRAELAIADVVVVFDRADRSRRCREHSSIDGLRSFCGVEMDANVRVRAGSILCLRCTRAAATVKRAPMPIVEGPPIALSALIDFLVEAFSEVEEANCAHQLAQLAGADESALAEQLPQMVTVTRTLSAQRLLALSVQVLKGRRPVRQLQLLRQSLVYGR
jgi:hypothetical protein